MRRHHLILTIVMVAGSIIASRSMAAGVCQGPVPMPGAVLHGPVLNVPDASSLCIAGGVSPNTWTRVSLGQAGLTRPQLMAAAFGQNATCRIDVDGVAACTIDGTDLADIVSRPETLKAATQWGRRLGPTRIASSDR